MPARRFSNGSCRTRIHSMPRSCRATSRYTRPPATPWLMRSLRYAERRSRSSKRFAPALIHDHAVVAHPLSILSRTGQPRQVIRRSDHIPIVQTSKKAHQFLVRIVPVAFRQFMHLGVQIDVVLVPERWSESIGIAACVRSMAAGALFVKYPPTQSDILAGSGTQWQPAWNSVQVRSDVRPHLRILQFASRDHGVHGRAVAFGVGEIGELPNEVGKTLAGERRNSSFCVAEGPRPVAFYAVLVKHLAAAFRMRIHGERGLGLSIHAFRRRGAEHRTREHRHGERARPDDNAGETRGRA